MKNILISGATGFVGKRLLQHLQKTSIENKYKLRIISRKLQSGYETILCDLEKERIPHAALEKVDTIFHLAGIAHDMREDKKIEDIYHSVNVNATVQLANLATKKSVKRFIFLSSVKAGDQTFSGEFNDKEKRSSESVYGRTKREAEIKLLEIGNKSSMQVSIVRSSLVYGFGMKGNLELMYKGIKKGWFPPLPETSNRKSMIHVEDLVSAILLIASNEETDCKIFIATDGLTYSSRRIYDEICNDIGKNIPKWYIPKFFFDFLSIFSKRIRFKVEKLFADEYYSSKELGKLGFVAKKTLKDINS